VEVQTLRRESEGRVIAVGSSTATVRLEPEETGGRLAIIEWNIPPNAPAPARHVHRTGTETFFVIEGEIDFVLADGPIHGTPGTSIHMPPGLPHTLSNTGAVPARLLEIFSPGELLHLIEDVGAVLSAGGPPDLAKLRAVFEAHDSAIVG
jgi:quercetin dioxygenase-like cupin family protein